MAEVPVEDFPAVVHPEWRRALPWLVQGTTTRGTGSGDEPFDLRLFPESEGSRARWRSLLAWSGLPSGAHAPQVHGAEIRWHEPPGQEGLALSPACDGHVTAELGLLLAVSVADCVPVSVVDPVRRKVAMIHAGWRGAAAGILEEAIASLVGEEVDDRELRVHLGPAICGRCYEVGGEVFAALGLSPPPAPRPIDLRAALARRAVDAGVAAASVTVSTHCTLCDPERRFFSHRGGDAERQVGFLGTRP
jgi:YfiH family protein